MIGPSRETGDGARRYFAETARRRGAIGARSEDSYDSGGALNVLICRGRRFFWSSRLPQFARFQRLSALIDRFSRLGRSYPPTSQSELCGNDRQPRYTWTGRSRARCDCERPTHDGTDRPEQDREGEHRSGRRKPFVPRPGPRRRPAALAAARRAKRSAVVSAFDIAAFHDVLEKIAGIVGHADAFISCDPGVSLRS